MDLDFAALARPGLQPVRCCRSRRCVAAVAVAQSRWTQQTGLVSVIFYSSASQGMTGVPMASLPYIYRLRIQIGRFHCGAGGGCMACLCTSHLNWAVLFGLLSLQHDKAKTAEKVSNHPCLSWCRPWHCGRGGGAPSRQRETKCTKGFCVSTAWTSAISNRLTTVQ